MGSQQLDNNMLKLTIHFRDGQDRFLTKDVNNGSGDVVDLKTLCEAMRSVQAETNSILTDLVEKERESNVTAHNVQNSNQVSEDEDDDDSDDDDAEPPAKQQKT